MIFPHKFQTSIYFKDFIITSYIFHNQMVCLNQLDTHRECFLKKWPDGPEGWRNLRMLGQRMATFFSPLFKGKKLSRPIFSGFVHIFFGGWSHPDLQELYFSWCAQKATRVTHSHEYWRESSRVLFLAMDRNISQPFYKNPLIKGGNCKIRSVFSFKPWFTLW